MKRTIRAIVLAVVMAFTIVPQPAKADPIIGEIIRRGVVRAIKAVDLQIQRLQLETVWIQNAQKTLENVLSQLKLDEISDWAQRQGDLFGDYYNELWRVKNTITQYQRIRDIAQNQALLVREYQAVWSLLRNSGNFSVAEITYMERVYSKILETSINNMQQIHVVVNAFRTQMSDAERLELVHRVDQDVRNNLADLRRFNRQNIGLDVQRGGNLLDLDLIQQIHGL
ncbi:conjugal transfer protein TraI [Belliella sp. DSM 111904]|uniref:Conjugal transfer protein TraI n=1 Tax=Belliella filtrata TaxID=2923435 RepID=A0ABS9V0X0_9BACT|nr:conjugal transfer protein TraI [Belliella filtrata]MCH7409999.1 conjugal transfer protein TraI [Belliella filtrata]